MRIEPNRASHAILDYAESLKRCVAEKFIPRLRAAYETREQRYVQRNSPKSLITQPIKFQERESI